MTRNLSETIGDIYEAVDDPKAWSEVIGRIAKLLGSEAGGLTLERLPSGSSVLNVSYGLPAGFTAEYVAYYHSVNLLLHRARRLFAPGAVIASHDICPETTFSNSEYYNDCLKKWGFFYVLGGVVAMNSGSAGLIQFLRPRRRGPFTPKEQDVLASLSPHLNRALRMHDATGVLTAVLETLDHIPTGVVLLNRQQRIVHMNRSASEILKRRDGLILEDGTLSTAPASMRIAFRKLLSTTLENTPDAQSCAESDALKIERISGAPAYSIVISRIRASLLALFDGQPALAIFISDPDQNTGSQIRRLRQLYGLSATEAKVAAFLMQGKDLSQACDALGITKNTGRTHLRSIFGKMDVKQQSQLVSVLTRGSPL